MPRDEQSVSEDDVRVILWDGPMAFYDLHERFEGVQAAD